MDNDKKIFLLDRSVSQMLAEEKTKPLLHKIFFTKIRLCKEVRYEKSPKNFLKIVKSGAQFTQTATYHKIDRKDFRKAKAHAKGHPIRKVRYRFQVEGCTVVVDAYRRQLKSLYLLEIAAECDENLHVLLHNPMLSKYIREDVTTDPRYEEKYLALYGNPSRYPYTIYTIFRKIENGKLASLDTVIFPEMKGADAIRIILCQKQHTLLTISQKAVKERAITHDAIERFIAQIEDMSQLFDIFELLFDPLTLQRTRSHLRKFMDIHRTYDDLIFIQNGFEKLRHKLDEDYLQRLRTNLEERITGEREKIVRYFTSREYRIVMRQLELLIKEKSRSYNSYESQLPLGYRVKIEQKRVFGNLRELTDLLDGCNDENSYRRIDTALKRIETFVALFQPLGLLTLKPKTLHNIEKVRQCMEKHTYRTKMLLFLRMLSSETASLGKEKSSKALLKREAKMIRKERAFPHKLYRKLHKVPL